MRNAVVLSALAGFAAAAPQMINIEAALAVPTPSVLGPQATETKSATVSYNPVAAASAVAEVVAEQGVVSKLRRRNSCASVPAAGDNDKAFLENAEFSAAANGAAAPTGYVRSFVNEKGSSQQIGYLTYKTLDTYSADQCADFCNSEKYCLGFNIFFERDPAVDPTEDCPNPASNTNIKCSLYGYPVAQKAATNDGQYRRDFHVVIAGSNGYSKADKTMCKSAPAAAGFNAPTNLPAAINAPLKDGYDTYNGMRLFNTNPYDPALCAAACDAQTEYDVNHPAQDGTFKPCNFFTSYILTQNGVPLGTYCSLYTDSWDSKYAVNTGYYWGQDEFSVLCAASYSATTPVTGFSTPKGNTAA